MKRSWNSGRALMAMTFLIVACGMVALAAMAQQRSRPGGRPGGGNPGMMNRMGGGNRDPRAGVPTWTVEEKFRSDVFTFVRLRYSTGGRRGGWAVDYPGADLNLSYRLEQLTSMKVDPEGLVMDIDDPELVNYPFAFIIDPRAIVFTASEAQALRKYLLGGGFLMIDDFWGNRMMDHLMGEMEKVFPDRKPTSLTLDHSIFHRPYPIGMKPQVPSEDSAHRTKDMPAPYRTWEDEISWEEPQPPDYRAYLDDHGRIMMLICWNTDLSDGWEEEGVSQWFFENYSEKLSYPMGVNIIFHVMTH
ncbi:MAG: DUF4159 domain-containing protein [Verrucomicrobiales bacterium]|nr:DUF4159 domain-containing protein [Verrucomicrobiales bacterium]